MNMDDMPNITVFQWEIIEKVHQLYGVLETMGQGSFIPMLRLSSLEFMFRDDNRILSGEYNIEHEVEIIAGYGVFRYLPETQAINVLTDRGKELLAQHRRSIERIA